MNLLDIVTVESKTFNNTVDVSKYEKDFKSIYSTLELLENDRNKNAINAGAFLTEKANEIVVNYFNDCFVNGGELTKKPLLKNIRHNGYGRYHIVDIKPSADWSLFFEAPKITTSSIRSISKIAEMVVIPFEYLNELSFRNEGFSLKRKIDNFKESCKKRNLDVYVVTPITNLSVQNMIDSYNSKQIITNSYSRYFDMLELMFPVLLMMNNNIKQLGFKVEELTTRVNDLSDEMKSVAASLVQVQKQISRIEIETKEKIKREIESLEKRQLETFYLPMDPMMVAFPKNTDITQDNAIGFIGPCWGPDFDPSMEALVKNHYIPNQRTKLIKQILG